MGSGRSERGSLDAWATISALTARTSTLRLGTMVSPASFRHPSELAKVVTTADHVSGGRVELGMGTGWSQVEHTAYRFEYNTVTPTLDQIAERRGNVVRACKPAGRAPIPFSVMTGVAIGDGRSDVEARSRRLVEWTGSEPDPSTWIAGTVEQAAERLRVYEQAGVERVYLQHLLHSDLEAVELIGRELVPALA